MALYAIADTHLSFGTDKPMDDFFGWNDYVSRLENNWRRLVENDDTVVIAGDISWASDFDELLPDLQYLNELPGKKIILKGNHDFWWNTAKKMSAFILDNNLDTISILHNNAFDCENYSVCGSRGWFMDEDSSHSAKIINREVGRLRMSIESAQNDNKIVFLHYPPITQNAVCYPIIDLLKEKGITECYYGHLHGSALSYAVQDIVDGTKFKLISADNLNFTPLFIHK